MPRIRFHGLGHRHATRLAASGVPPKLFRSGEGVPAPASRSILTVMFVRLAGRRRRAG